MTTIALDADGMIAADTQTTWDNGIMTRGHKIVRLKCGGVAGFAGNAPECQRLAEYCAGSMKGRPPKLKDAIAVLHFGNGRRGYVDRGKWILDEVIGPVAIGTGAQAAMAIMHTGGNALEAVQAAAMCDSMTSGPFDVLTVESKRKRKGRT